MAEKILQCGYMSGDTYSAAALMAANPAVRTILLVDTNATGQYADKSKLIEKIYTETGVIGQVSRLDITGQVPIGNIWKTVSGAYSSKLGGPNPRSTDAEAVVLRKLYQDYSPKGSWPRSITAVTGLLASAWKKNRKGTQKAVAEAWKVGKLPSEQKFRLYEYMGSKFAKSGFDIRKNIVVLWSRQSGKRGGAHLELDSSYKGIRQLAYHFAEKNKRATVLLAGDEKNSKMANFAAPYRQIIDVTQMWDAPVWKTHFGEATFLAQFAFFKYLAEDYRVIHLGMRSGILESMALLGMETFYLEDKGSGSGNRMVGFSNAGITYRRIQISEAPGITGRITQKNKIFSKESVEGSISKKAETQKKRGGFKHNFGGHGEDTDWAAKGYAKASLVGVWLDDRDYDTAVNQWEELAMDLTGLRGFKKPDFEAITKVVEGRFV